jgi:hypothetical protein
MHTVELKLATCVLIGGFKEQMTNSCYVLWGANLVLFVSNCGKLCRLVQGQRMSPSIFGTLTSRILNSRTNIQKHCASFYANIKWFVASFIEENSYFLDMTNCDTK